MRERHVLIFPRAGLVQLQLTGTEQHLGGLAVDRVAIGVHLVGEGVELALSLKPVEGPLNHEGIQRPDVSHRARIGPQVGRRNPVIEVGELHLDHGV